MKNKNNIVLSVIADNSWPIVRMVVFAAIMCNGAISFGAAAPERRRMVRSATTAEAVFEKMKNNLQCTRKENAAEYAEFKAGNVSLEQFERQEQKRVDEQRRLVEWQAKGQEVYGREAGIINMAKKNQFDSGTYARNIQELRKLPENAGGGPTIKDQFGKTPLMWAAQIGQVNMMRQLFEDKIAFVNALDFDNGSALRWAMNGPKGVMSQVVQLLLENGAQQTINTKTTGVDPMTNESSQRTPLQWLLRRHPNSMGKGQEGVSEVVINNVVQQLLVAGADPLSKDKSDKTAIYWALALNDLNLALELYNHADQRHIDPVMQLSFVEGVLRASEFMENYLDLKFALSFLNDNMGVPVDRLLAQALSNIARQTKAITPAEATILEHDTMPLVMAGLAAAAIPKTMTKHEQGPVTMPQPAAPRPIAPSPRGEITAGLEGLTPEELAFVLSGPGFVPGGIPVEFVGLTPEQLVNALELLKAMPDLDPKDIVPMIIGVEVPRPAPAIAGQPALRPAVRQRPAMRPEVVPQPAAPRQGAEFVAGAFGWIDGLVDELRAKVEEFFNQPDWNNMPFELSLFRMLNDTWQDARCADGYDMTKFDRIKARLQKYADNRQKKRGLPAKEQDNIRGALALGVFQ